MRSYSHLSIAFVAIAVSVFSAEAQVARASDRRAAQGVTAPVDKTHRGSLFGSHSYFRGVIPDDVYQLDDVGMRCNESGAPDERSPARCRRFHSDSANTTFVVRLARDKHLTFYYENAGGKQKLVPYTVYDNNTYQMSFMSDKAQQFASAHGLGTGVPVASTRAPSVAVANPQHQYCASLPPAARLACDQEARSASRATPSATQPPTATSSCATLSGIAKTVCENGAKFLGK